MDIRKYGIAIAVTILTAFLIHAIAAAIAGPGPDYPSCWNNRVDVGNGPVPAKGYVNGAETNCVNPPVDITARDACVQSKGQYMGVQDQNGCVASYECSYCQMQYDEASQHNKLNYFYAAIIIGVLFIIGGFLLPLGAIHEWVGLGFIFGGVIGLFIGTVAYWSNLGRWLKPLVLALELIVVLFIIYKRMGSEKRAEPVAVASATSSARKKK